MLRKPGPMLAVVLAGLFASACSATRPADPGTCAVVGAAIGGLSGTGIGANVDNDDDEKEGAYIGAAAGAATGALAGYAICALMPEAAPPPPPPAPAPAPKPAAKAVQKTIVLPGVNFAFNKADLLPEAKAILDREVVPEVKADSAIELSIEGHTDSVGSDVYNEKLSGQRAGSVWKYLVSQGIDSSRMQAKGYGETQPIASNDTAEGRAKNRRVEIKVIK